MDKSLKLFQKRNKASITVIMAFINLVNNIYGSPVSAGKRYKNLKDRN